MRSRQVRIGLLGVDRVLPRSRHELASDWEQRIDRFSANRVSPPLRPWGDVAGLRFRGNAAWLAGNSGRTMQHKRDLARLELHYHDFMKQGIMEPSEAWEFLSGYLSEHRNRAADSTNEWHPYSVSNRLASWLEFLAHAPSPDEAELRETLANECLLLADFVTWLLERDIEANHLLKNLWSIALCDLLLSPDEKRIESSVRAYVAELERQVLPDGGHYELSPMYHAKLLLDARSIETLLDESDESARSLRKIAGKAASWLESFRMSEDAWANVNDSWTVPELAKRIWNDDTWKPVSGLKHLENSGFVRGTMSDWNWLFDVGGVSPSFNPGHSHSDALSIVLYHGGTPVIVDPGVLHYSPNDERQFLKSCHAHNGPCTRYSDHTEFIGTFRVGSSGKAKFEEMSFEGDEQRASATLDGYREVNVRRDVMFRYERAKITDTWRSNGEEKPAIWSRFLWNAVLSDVEDCRVEANRIVLRFSPPEGGKQFELEVRVSGVSDPRLGVQESFFSDEFGKKLSGVETIVTGNVRDEMAQVFTMIRGVD
ncbi:heparinase II/III family protein [Pelagicoccus mobilis]|uniref:Alginate lyase family protein n=1 Tax=Pelagicoccus mobilis TaxID=415221 RepID=A0A934S1Y7_9BACT|nr:heparinase II/III family protein [Pelagicoccus mobilis]MBK1877944.1 alginate lyase family protein [Pelagicoccus mobilis]